MNHGPHKSEQPTVKTLAWPQPNVTTQYSSNQVKRTRRRRYRACPARRIIVGSFASAGKAGTFRKSPAIKIRCWSALSSRLRRLPGDAEPRCGLKNKHNPPRRCAGRPVHNGMSPQRICIRARIAELQTVSGKLVPDVAESAVATDWLMASPRGGDEIGILGRKTLDI